MIWKVGVVLFHLPVAKLPLPFKMFIYLFQLCNVATGVTMSDDVEIWRPIIIWPEYEVSNLGRVRRIVSPRCSKTRVLKNILKKKGYAAVNLSHNNYREQKKVHLLVLEAFVGPRPIGYFANHKDGDKHNPRLDNIEYVTPAENSQHSLSVLKRGSGGRGKKQVLDDDKVRKIRKLYATGEYSQSELAKMFGLGCGGQVSRIINKIHWRWVKD